MFKIINNNDDDIQMRVVLRYKISGNHYFLPSYKNVVMPNPPQSIIV